jgi:hypothetical protein
VTVSIAGAVGDVADDDAHARARSGPATTRLGRDPVEADIVAQAERQADRQAVSVTWLSPSAVIASDQVVAVPSNGAAAGAHHAGEAAAVRLGIGPQQVAAEEAAGLPAHLVLERADRVGLVLADVSSV